MLVWKISGKRPKLYRELVSKLSIFLFLLLALESNNYSSYLNGELLSFTFGETGEDALSVYTSS
ncbi:MAG: hypothetical protein DWQ58_05620 [Microcystis aeruginosa TA09]|nr:MAG: hypothetical protein DWQ58_05620 [Microcystis aeruginosa TA09]